MTTELMNAMSVLDKVRDKMNDYDYKVIADCLMNMYQQQKEKNVIHDNFEVVIQPVNPLRRVIYHFTTAR